MMEVFRGGELVCRASVAETFLSRLRGLMLRAELKPEEGLLIEYSPRFRSRAVHSMFMRFPIDLVFLDSEKRVVDTATLRPWRFYDPGCDCRWVLELQEGAVEKRGIKKGDLLRFEMSERKRR
ncbi:MAG: DUF192 domain-containing protein [Methanobacteriota archaeon]|nr:MAG: DUF192 domain-containing protein [Euryarchaeota archaeon]